MKIKAMRDKVIVSDIQRGERLVGKIILLNDDGKSDGVRSRWAQVYAIGEDIKGIEVGEWILIEHGNWTRGIKLEDDDGEEFTIWGVNWPDGVMAVADSPTETFAGDQIVQGQDAAKLKRE